MSVVELGHLLTRSGLTYPEVSPKGYHDSFCKLGRTVCHHHPHHHHHHHHHISVTQLARSGLTYPEISSKVYHDSFCQLGSSVCYHHRHHHHHHHVSLMQLGHLLTRSGLTYPEVSSKVYHDSFCQLLSSVSLSWVIYFEAFYLHVVHIYSIRNVRKHVEIHQCPKWNAKPR